MTPISVTNGVLVKVVSSPSELAQAQWDGWVPVDGRVPVVFHTADPGSTLAGFLELLANTFVAKTDLVISPSRPTSAPDGTVHIKNSTD